MKYKKLTGIILKKFNYLEADQIITVWTKEAGKVRLMARGVRLPKSKLVYNLAEMSLIGFETAGRKNLPTIIGAQTIQGFSGLKNDLLKMASTIYTSELVMKMTADEHPNEQVYELLLEFLKELNSIDSFEHYHLLDNFALRLAQVLGFGNPKKANSHFEVRDFIEGLIERQIKSEPFLAQL